jgi:hypothetical protein
LTSSSNSRRRSLGEPSRVSSRPQPRSSLASEAALAGVRSNVTSKGWSSLACNLSTL